MPVVNTPPRTSSEGNIENNCALCSTVMDNTNPCYHLACKHVFHKNCVEAWLTENSCCYSCNAPINKKEIKVVVGNCSPFRAQPLPVPTAPVQRGVTTRNLARALAQLEEANPANIPEPLPLNTSGAPSSVLDASQSTEHREGIARHPRGRPRSGRPVRTIDSRRTQAVDYNTIQDMIEQTVTRVLSSLSIQHLPPPSNSQGPDMTREQASFSSSSISSRQTVDIMQKWGVHFDGSTDGLGVEEFIYRIKALTDKTLGSDFTSMCKNMHVLFTGKARSWYWRYHKQVDGIVWSNICASLRQHYKDYRSDFMSMELIRARKQKHGEPFSAFYEAVASLIDKASIKIEEEEFIEILKNNLLPETRQKLLYQPVHSVGHLRRLVQMSENLSHEISCRTEQVKTKSIPNRRQVFALEDHSSEVEEISPTGAEIAALRRSTEKLKCWNCEEIGHIWENCLADRRVFCYGCGRPDTYKPQCQNCLQKQSENRPTGAFNKNRMPPKI
ncbi:uncharacterized protein LOC120322428 [Drosophila yakuba]|uniref:uncharacterized protein LOC120322428 n=1 Tax=Drosophila yakuba TaxID=7245 RepID=UPI0019307FEC|nr:uncharacterized protein LOC120322428 [Drosophila yakuba]